MDNLSNIEPECPKPERNVNIDGDASGTTIITGDRNVIHQSSSTHVSPSQISEVFLDHTARALRNSQPFIEGLDKPIPRDEIEEVENALSAGDGVIISGPSGTGKSGLSYQLIENAKEREQCCLLLDCRRNIHSPSDFKSQLSLEHLSLHRACKSVNEYHKSQQPFLLVFDQMDSVVGMPVADELIQIAVDCHCHESPRIQVVVISRNGEVQEQRLLAPLYQNNFQTIRSKPIVNAAPYLEILGIDDPSPEIIEMSRNLLNLSLLATIHSRNPNFNFRDIVNEFDLWNERLEIFLKQNVEKGPHWLAELISLAKCALNEESGTFVLDDPPPESQLRLLSERFIKRRSETSRVCAFFHEDLQDFLYAKDAVETGKSIYEVMDELGRFQVQGILIWMDKISQLQEPLNSNREAILRRLLNV